MEYITAVHFYYVHKKVLNKHKFIYYNTNAGCTKYYGHFCISWGPPYPPGIKVQILNVTKPDSVDRDCSYENRPQMLWNLGNLTNVVSAQLDQIVD